MTSMQRLAATAVPVTLEEVDQVIRRAYRAIKPRTGRLDTGEIVYYLTPDEEDPTNVIRVQTSVFRGGAAKGQGEDSFRVVLLNLKTDKPIAGKAARVHRVEGWRDNLRKRIDDAIETFEDLKEEREQARERARVREEQQRFQREHPQEALSELDRQIGILQALAKSRIPSAGVFADMLDRTQSRKTLLSPKQLAWAEREYSRIR
jgi:hypothetical protein